MFGRNFLLILIPLNVVNEKLLKLSKLIGNLNCKSLILLNIMMMKKRTKKKSLSKTLQRYSFETCRKRLEKKLYLTVS
jgi:hypothetical protein